MQRFIFWENYLLTLAGLNREVPVLLFNFFLGFSQCFFMFLTLWNSFMCDVLPPSPVLFQLVFARAAYFCCLFSPERNWGTWSCPIKWETLPLILLDTELSPVLLLLFSCPGTVYNFLSLSIFLLIEFTCCFPFSRLTELLNKIMSGASSLCCPITNFLRSDKCVAICLILMCLQYVSRLLCRDGFDGQIKLY